MKHFHVNKKLKYSMHAIWTQDLNRKNRLQTVGFFQNTVIIKQGSISSRISKPTKNALYSSGGKNAPERVSAADQIYGLL